MKDEEINNMLNEASNTNRKDLANYHREDLDIAEFKKHLSERMTELNENLASLYDIRDRGFAESLCEWYTKKGWLSDKQAWHALRFWQETGNGNPKGIEKLKTFRCPADKILPPRISVDGRTLIRYFDAAAKKLQRPRIKYKILPKPIHGCEQLIFYRTGEQSASPMSVGVTNGLDYPNNRVLALMYRDGRTIFYAWTFDKPELQLLIKRVAEDPLAAFSENGRLTKYCCYCGRALTHPSSTHYGYGPICAENFGLPWGDVPLQHQQLSIGLQDSEDAKD